MERKGLHRVTLLNRIVWFAVAFALTLLLQMGISVYQTRYVMQPLENRLENIHAISQFLNDAENCVETLENYRWDYGDAGTLADTLRRQQKDSAAQLARINCTLGQVSEEHYLLGSAVKTTHTTFFRTVEEILESLEAGESDRASSLYYDKAKACGEYMQEYTQQLLERAILDNQSAYSSLTRLNGQLKNLQQLVTIVCILLGVLVVWSLMKLLKSVKEMAAASQAISRGNLDTPDVDDTLGDEIGDMARAFNEMKRSMKQQVTLLEEKNSIERELFRKENEALELQNLMEREKLQQLRSQINPHFLFNTLNVIRYTAQQEGADQTHALISSLSRLFRYALISNEVQVPLSREIRIVEEFYALYHARFGERVRLQWHLSPEIDLTETMVPSFILQPLVENAFKHGLSPKEEGGKVDISLYPEEGLLHIDVVDDGVGMTPEALDSLRKNLRNPPTTGEHIGVYNVAARLRLLGEECGMDITSEAGKGTRAALWLPLVTAGEEEEDTNDQNSDRR